MALGGYACDAAFNFPMERPIMQFFFAFILAMHVNIFLSSRSSNKSAKGSLLIQPFYAFLIFITLIPAFYIAYQTYQSMVIQGRVNPDLSNPSPVFTSNEANKLPSIPNLNVFTYPIDAIKARYYLNEKKYDSSLLFLNKSANVNPWLPYNDFLKAATYLELGKMDSAFIFAKKAFSLRPRATSTSNLLNFVCLRLKDTNTINQAYYELRKYPNTSLQSNGYLSTMLQLPHDKQRLLTICDSIIKIYPDSAFLQQRRLEIVGSTNNPSQGTNQQPALVNEGNSFSNKAAIAFNNHDFKTAALYFIKASELKPGDFGDVENAAMCYYSLNEFKKALLLYEKVIQSNTIQTGKSEFFKGICLENLGKKDEGCIFLKKAKAKNYSEAETYLKIYCK